MAFVVNFRRNAMGAAELAGRDDASRALMLPLDQGVLPWPATDRVLFLGARDSMALHERDTTRLLCQQSFKPFADALADKGWSVGGPVPGARFALVLLLLPRQRDERRAMLARALDHVAPGGHVLAAVANHDGARSAQTDMQQLAGTVQHLSKHKCRVFWTCPEASTVDVKLRKQWRELDALRPTVAGMVS